ncbi:MazG nucleotide pyrophosphohydrolase domain-containing protein [Streptomyces sp. NPDC004682]
MTTGNEPCLSGEPTRSLSPYDTEASGLLHLALLAADHADVCVVGRLTAAPDSAACVLEVAAEGGGFPPGARPVVLRGTMAYGADAPGGRTGWLPLRGIRVTGAPGGSYDLSALDEPRRIATLGAAGLDAVEALAGGDPPLAPPQRERIRAAQTEALVPLAKGCGDLARTLVTEPVEDVPALRRLQENCRDLYGRLEPERALAWALEELGELAQAMRRGESTVRLEEELGQVLAWSLCLANITRTDAAHAFAKSYSTELERQMRKHGAVRPYRRQVLPC